MNPQQIRIDQYDYPLDGERIAKHPLAVRDACKLLVHRVSDGGISDHIFSELPDLLPEDTLLVYNNTRVIKARLRFTKPGPGGAHIEIFCLEPCEPADYERNFAARGSCSWQCLTGNSKRWKAGPLHMKLPMDDGTEAVLTAEREDTSGEIHFSWTPSHLTFSEIISLAGEIPIPPYLNRNSEASDTSDYQTVFSHIEGSVAAPTAGLHFTPALLQAIDRRGIERMEVTLHVGAGTFRPVKSESIGEHDMHSEFITVPRDTIASLAGACGRRSIIAVGTTSVRTLESLYHAGRMMLSGTWRGEVPQWAPYADDANDTDPCEALRAIVDYLDRNGDDTFTARTRIIIAPGYSYRIVDGMITNFHQPKSTLLLLVSAFTGDDWRRLYDHALNGDYRFLSYGDAMLLLR